MKVRIRANTIRFRLGRTEVESLRNGEIVEERIDFDPENAMTWRVAVGPDGTEPCLEASPGRLDVTIPPLGWLGDETVEGYRTTVESASGYEVIVAVERDYACLAPRDPAEDRDSFPHPDDGC